MLNKLTSRTFWLTLLTVGTLILQEQYTEASSVAIAYILGEKALDATRPKAVDYTSTELDLASDNSRIVTGVGTVRPADADEE